MVIYRFDPYRNIKGVHWADEETETDSGTEPESDGGGETETFEFHFRFQVLGGDDTPDVLMARFGDQVLRFGRQTGGLSPEPGYDGELLSFAGVIPEGSEYPGDDSSAGYYLIRSHTAPTWPQGPAPLAWDPLAGSTFPHDQIVLEPDDIGYRVYEGERHDDDIYP